MITLKRKYLICLVIPLLVILSMTIYPILTTQYGTELALESTVYYSSDTFRGNNISVQYKISEVPISKISPEILSIKSNKKLDVYAILIKKDAFYEVKKLTKNRPKEGIYLKCSIYPYNFQQSSDVTPIYVNYQLDKYFISKETTLLNNIEFNKENQWNYIAYISVYKGNSILKDVKIK